MAEMPPVEPAKLSPSAVRRALCHEALRLARRADAAGLDRAAALLRLAALHAAETEVRASYEERPARRPAPPIPTSRKH